MTVFDHGKLICRHLFLLWSIDRDLKQMPDNPDIDMEH